MGDNEQCSELKARRKNTKKEQSKHGPLRFQENLSSSSFKGHLKIQYHLHSPARSSMFMYIYYSNV